MKRVFLTVIDACGCGALPDSLDYGDPSTCNTLGNVAKYVDGINLINMQKLGLGNIIDILGTPNTETPIAAFGKMAEKSKGKDTTTGHWEIAGIILEEPFQTYPNGFPNELISEFISKTNCKNILANYPASGTEIIDKLGKKHQETSFPIIYTSADSVFQIACHTDTISLTQLYSWCAIAREILNDKYNVSRVIARPFNGEPGNYKRIPYQRKDYSLKPPKETILNTIQNNAGKVIAVGKIEDIFVKSGITHAIHTGGNTEGLKIIKKILNNDLNLKEIELNKSNYSDKELIFTNLVDTDMLYGHRNDPIGYSKALLEIDSYIPDFLKDLNDDDLFIITADHGCDPTAKGTDHTREYVPLIVYNKNLPAKNLGIRETFADISASISEWLNLPWNGPGKSFL